MDAKPANVFSMAKPFFYMASMLHRYVSYYRGLAPICWTGIGVTIISDTAGGVCFFLSLYFVNDLHIDVASAGLIIASYGVGTAIGGTIGGKLADQFSPGSVSIMGLLVKAVLFFALMKLTAFWPLVLTELLLGTAAYVFMTASKIWVLAHCHDQGQIKLKVLSMLYAASNLGIGLSAAIVSWLSVYGFHLIFLSAGTLLFLAALVLVVGEKKALSNMPAVKKVHSVEAKDSMVHQGNKFASYLVLSCLFSIGLVIAQLSTTYTLYISERFPALGAKAAGPLFILNSALILCFQPPLANYVDRFNKILMVGVGACLMGVGMAVLSYVGAYPLAIVAMLLYTLGEMVFFAVAQFIVYQQSGEKKKGQGLGLFQSTYALSVIIGPMMGGHIYHVAGAKVLWHLCGLIGIASLFACLKFKERAWTVSPQC